MSLPFQIGGAVTYIPGVYSTFSVAGSLPAPVPAGRNVLILGEAEEGVPGTLLDLKANFYQDFQSVKEFYKSGPIVDAARQLFSNQPSAVFTGSVARLYVYKTNQSTRAEKAISSPSNFGSLVAARYGEAGNQIKTQIKEGQAESKPSKTIQYLPSPAARSFRVSVNGAVTGSIALLADDTAAQFQSAINALTGVAAAGGTARTVAAASFVADTTASGDSLTVTKTSGVGTLGTDTVAGDIAYIPAGSALAGAGDANAGCYVVISWSATSATMKKVKSVDASAEIGAAPLLSLVGVTITTGDIVANAPVVVSVDAATATGSGASLEISENAADKLVAGLLHADDSFSNGLVNATSSVANISVSVPSAGKMTVSLSSGSWSRIPKAGDLISVSRSSAISGATKKNVGVMIVESASSQSITASHLFAAMTTEAVASAAVNGANDILKIADGFASSSIAARRLDSSAEAKAKIEASRQSDGASLPQSLIGGNVALELSYWNSAATAASVSINQQRVMSVTLTGTGLTGFSVNTKKYATLQELADYLNTQAGMSVRIPDSRMRSLSPDVLDMVTSIGILSCHAVAAYNGRLKKDYYDWKQFFVDNSALVSFKEGGMSIKAGFPAAEASASFLSGAAVGGTSSANIQDGLDQGLKISARQVVPLFSRDAYLDIADGLTDSSSSYGIDSINAAVKAHVSTASSTLFRKERFGMLSFDGKFSDAVQKVGEISYERCQMFFERHDATNGDGQLAKFLPWMAACSAAAARSQAVLGTSLLRKPLLLNSATHTGEDSLYADTLASDFDPDNRGDLEEAIAAGLMVLRSVPGFGVRVESPDLSTRSRSNDPQGWVYERVSVLHTADAVVDTCRNVLENFIGNRTSDTPVAIVRSALNDTLASFVVGSGDGSLLSAQVLDVKSLGNQYKAQIKITPAEALEAIILDVTAERSI